ncbi:MAG: hypothetical protein ACWGNV_06545, partial [Bacteroidales bacterium]
MKRFHIFPTLMIILLAMGGCRTEPDRPSGGYMLHAEDFHHYVDYFNRMEDENIVQAISNEESWEWMKEQIPLF